MSIWISKYGNTDAYIKKVLPNIVQKAAEGVRIWFLDLSMRLPEFGDDGCANLVGLYLKHMGAQGIQHVLRFAADCRGGVLINLSYMIIDLVISARA